MESLKIALVSDWYYPKLGGVAVHMHDLALYLRKLGHEVDIITNDRETGKETELKREGIGLIKVPGYTFGSIGINMTVFSRNASRLIPYVRNYDVVHGQHAFTPLALKAVSAGRKAGKATLLTTHSINYENSPVIKALARMAFPYFRYYLGNPHRIIAVSRASKEFMRRFTRIPIEVIQNGVNVDFFDVPLSKEEAKEKLGLGERVILYVGRLEPRKGISTLINAMKHVDGTLLIAGQGSMLPLLRERAKLLGVSKKVKFLGVVEYSRLPLYYRASDVFVLPSLSEAFGIVLLEAMASGTPVIGTKVGGIPEIIDGCGLLVPPGNAKELANAINLVLNNQSVERRLSRLGKRRVEKVYDWNVVVRKIEALYREVLDEVVGDG
ncbi:glycosyltransferase family 4 protein [Thermococcus gammatolerans]|uniref:Glycosyltransferase, family 1 n=1 Tax=Thermococcus gammatolerans (strain DSM 15229 / JCM 11827 / EJ3) TaxID=593117 RepID=C5A3Y0_THEGJ|nr:glycosyltransferase family 4 protein [Thermococcus gammatolerans]ACS32942.1 Glycosyltransferase, family 1 [Thermococcus gammatolerans EJ3]